MLAPSFFFLVINTLVVNGLSPRSVLRQADMAVAPTSEAPEEWTLRYPEEEMIYPQDTESLIPNGVRLLIDFWFRRLLFTFGCLRLAVVARIRHHRP